MTHNALWGTPTISTEEDSTDLSDHEVESAVPTSDFNQLAQLLSRALAPDTPTVGKSYAVARHEIRRRCPHLYLRSHLVCPGEPQRVLLHRVDWLEDA